MISAAAAERDAARSTRPPRSRTAPSAAICEVAERCVIRETEVGDYSYIMQDAQSLGGADRQVRQHRLSRAHQRAQSSRLGARRCIISPTAPTTTGPTPSATRVSSTGGARMRSTIGHDVWIGHGATILPGVDVGNGAVDRRRRGRHARRRALYDRRRRAGAADQAALRARQSASAWTRSPGGTGATRRCAPRSRDFRALSAEAFLEKYGA